jgi:Fic family protein
MPIPSSSIPEFIWQRPDWPTWRWSEPTLQPQIAAVEQARLRLLEKLRGLDDEHRSLVAAELYTRETVSTSAIEGVQVDAAAARSSIIRRLKLGVAPNREWQVSDQTRGLIDILADSTQNPAALTAERLKAWHGALFPAGRVGLMPILTGEFRVSAEPMQVISATRTGERVHYEAPPSDRLDAEIECFLLWFNQTSRSDDSGINATVRACIAHLWFETLHPFEDGNGRIGRAVWDLAMMQTSPDPLPQINRVWAVSSVINKRKLDYWAELEAAQRGDLDITSWLRFATDCVAQAYAEAGQCVDRVMQIAWFWVRHRGAALNERQRKALNLALSGDALDDGWLTNRRYIKLTQCGSPVTASRDLAQLEQWGMITKDPESGGRSTRYAIALNDSKQGQKHS